MLPEGSSMEEHPDFYGCICQPRMRQVPRGLIEGRMWVYDNDCFNGGFDPAQWARTLVKLLPYRRQCRFVVMPDVVGDSVRTKSLWYQWLPMIQTYKFPLAYVAQNGQSELDLPEHASAMFIGGDDSFKLGEEGRVCVEQAKRRGMWVHMGRVNSLKRLRYAQNLGCDSVDGTYVCFGKDINTPKLTSMMRTVLYGQKQFSLGI